MIAHERCPPRPCSPRPTSIHRVVALLGLVFVLYCVRPSQSPYCPQLDVSAPTLNRPAGKAVFTVFINTFRRPGCLVQQLLHWRNCSRWIEPSQDLIDIRVVWNDPQSQPPLTSPYLSATWMRYPSANLSNRFNMWQNAQHPIETAAIFSVDDDVLYGCNLIWQTFALWEKNPGHMVGFAPRYVNRTTMTYRWVQTWETGGYNALWVTKGAFLHRTFFSYYFLPSYRNLRDYTDEHTTGEDILMAYVYAFHSKKPPIFVPTNSQSITNLNCGSRTLGERSSRHRYRVLKLIDEYFTSRNLRSRPLLPEVQCSRRYLAARGAVPV